MKRIDLIFDALQNKRYKEGVTASELATHLQLDRANVSSDLNKLVKDGRLYKTGTRPVLFFINTNTDLETPSKQTTSLDTFAKENKSLKIAIEKAKAAVLYPPNGMHTLILGETGVGKSFFASFMHEYAIEVKQLKEDAPFVVFNCADYANNPQLLLGQLFGIKKGAYTGANEQKGLLEKAHEGILFLDEVHRLPPEGQEMLFTFIDRGVYRRLGETESERNANVLIIAATTEEPNSFLLKTFTRRIPMTLTLPPLRERSYEERFSLLKLFFKNEALRLRKEIHVSPNAMRSFVFYQCPNNIGQLKTDVQIACAKAYSDFVTKKGEYIRVSSTDLPWYMKEGLFIERKSRHLFQVPNETFVFSGNEHVRQQDDNSSRSSIYEFIDHKYEELQARGIEENELELLIENDIQSFFMKYFNQMSKKTNHENVFKIVDPSIVNVCEKIAALVETRLAKTFDEKVFLALNLHVQTTLQRIRSGKQIHHPQLNQIRSKYKEAFSVAMQSIQLLEEKLQVTMPIDEAGFLTMFFVVDPIPATQTEVKVLVLAHGNGIATEMANVANELLGIEDVTGIDMPLHESPKDFLERVKLYMKTLEKHISGLLLLVDMGSLAYIGDLLQTEFHVPVRVLSMTSTPHVLEAARKAQLGYSLDALYDTVKNLTPFYLDIQEEKKKSNMQMKSVILTACLTGEGSALAIQKMLENYLRFDKEMIEIIPISIVHQKDLTKMIENVKKERNIICIVTNFDVQVPCLTYHFQDIVNYKAIQPIQELIMYEETYTKMADMLGQQMNRTDGALIIKTIRYALNTIQELINLQLNPDSLMGVILHMSCMVDRLQKGEDLLPYPEKETRRHDEYWMYMKIKKTLQPIEKTFEIKIPDDEVFYVMDFFLKNQPV